MHSQSWRSDTAAVVSALFSVMAQAGSVPLTLNGDSTTPVVSTAHAAPPTDDSGGLKFKVTIDSAGDIQVNSTGQNTHVITDGEARSFMFDSHNLKDMASAASSAVNGNFYALKPDDAVIRPPTPWDENGQNVWQRYGKEPVSIQVTPLGSGRLKPPVPKTILLDSTTLENDTKNTAAYLCSGLEVTKQNTTSYSWIRGASDSIAAKINLDINGIGGSGSYAKETYWGEEKRFSDSITFSAGQSGCICVKPKCKYRVIMTADFSDLVAEQDYRAVVSGGYLLANYTRPYYGHHFYFWWMPDVMRIPRYAGMPHNIDGTMQVELGYYSNKTVKIQDLKTLQWIKPSQLGSSPFLGDSGDC